MIRRAMNNQLIEHGDDEAYNWNSNQHIYVKWSRMVTVSVAARVPRTFRTSSKTNMDRTSAGSAAGDPSPTWMVRTCKGTLMRKHGGSHGFPSSITGPLRFAVHWRKYKELYIRNWAPASAIISFKSYVSAHLLTARVQTRNLRVTQPRNAERKHKKGRKKV